MFTLNSAQLSLGLQGLGALTSTVGSFYQAKSMKSSLNYQAGMSAINARLAETGAQSVLQQGQQQVAGLTLSAGMLKSKQTAAQAANGIDLGTGSAAEVRASTDIMKEIDANTLTSNAVKNAWGYRTYGVNAANEGLIQSATASGISPFSAAQSSLLSGAGQVASSWYMLNKVGAIPNQPAIPVASGGQFGSLGIGSNAPWMMP